MSSASFHSIPIFLLDAPFPSFDFIRSVFPANYLAARHCPIVTALRVGKYALHHSSSIFYLPQHSQQQNANNLLHASDLHRQPRVATVAFIYNVHPSSFSNLNNVGFALLLRCAASMHPNRFVQSYRRLSIYRRPFHLLLPQAHKVARLA